MEYFHVIFLENLFDWVPKQHGNVVIILPGARKTNRLSTTASAALVIEALVLAAEKDLTAHDACYAVLARQLGVPLVTADRALAQVVDWAVWKVAFIPYRNTIRLGIVPEIREAYGFLEGIDTTIEREDADRL
jgi:hypothetical protein